MKAELATARSHPAALASIVMAGIAVTVLAVVTLAYLLGWIPARNALPSAPGSMASPGQQLAGTAPGGLDLLPGETLVAPAEAPGPEMPQSPKPATPQYARPAPPQSPKPAAAPRKPNYNRAEPAYTTYERSTRNICINCGTVAAVASSGGEWEVRVRFEDGSTEALRYPGRPRLRVGEHVRLEDGRLIPE